MKSPYDPKENPQAWQAWQCLTRTGVNLFLTGKAGTGKTTFLKNLRESHSKNLVVTAPTGVAAINAGGVTLHSFFQLPPGLFTPDKPLTTERNIRQSKINVMRSMDLLVIDEISMVRADLLDAVDARLREVRRDQRPFGGVQLLLIGDLMQLSPVVRYDEEPILRQYYPNNYFFSSKALSLTQFFTIELQHIYRQSDADFIDILNQIRGGSPSAEALAKLNTRYIPNFNPDEKEEYIRLTTHHETADATNEAKLAQLRTKKMMYESTVEGTFPESMYPTTNCLILKEGAQVMFLRNDKQEPRRYYNGKVGHVVRLDKDFVVVACEGDDGAKEEIVVTYEKWENMAYELNEETGQTEEKSVGTFSQIPLTLAWAITIHKSQGLTFDRAIIDAARSFSAGQVYVALSRCRTFDGLVLGSAITPQSVMSNREVNAFCQSNVNCLTDSMIEEFAARHTYRELIDVFNFAEIINTLGKISNFFERFAGKKFYNNFRAIDELYHEEAAGIQDVATRFYALIDKEMREKGDITKSELAMAKAKSGAAYFMEREGQFYANIIANANLSLDDAADRKRLTSYLEQLHQSHAVKQAVLKAVADNGFSTSMVMQARVQALCHLEDDAVAGDGMGAEINNVTNRDLYVELYKWRNDQAKKENRPKSKVMPVNSLIDIADTVPRNVTELKRVEGVSTERLNKYANDILNIVSKHHKKGAKATEEAKLRLKTAKEESRVISLNAFRRLGDVKAVAKERNLAESTIVVHLLSFVGTKLDINDLIPPDTYKAIEKAIRKLGADDKLPQEVYKKYGYEYVKYVRDHRE